MPQGDCVHRSECSSQAAGPRWHRGFGICGLPLAVELPRAGFPVIGDILNATLAPLVEAGQLRASADFGELLNLDTVDVCVPTPLRKTKDPDMSYIISSC